MTLEGATNFLFNYLKEAKFDNVVLNVHSEVVQFCQSYKLTLNDIHKMNDEQFDGFKHIIKNFNGDIIMRDIS